MNDLGIYVANVVHAGHQLRLHQARDDVSQRLALGSLWSVFLCDQSCWMDFTAGE